MIIIPEYLAIHEPKEELLEIINNKEFKDKVLYKKQSDFHDIKIIENEVGRFLHYKDTYQAGFINTTEYKGNLPYINYFTIPYLINPEIKNILLMYPSVYPAKKSSSTRWTIFIQKKNGN